METYGTGGLWGPLHRYIPWPRRTFFCVKPYRYLPASQIGLTSLSLRFPPALQLSVVHESLASHQLSSHQNLSHLGDRRRGVAQLMQHGALR